MTKEILLDIQRQEIKCQQQLKKIDNIFTIISSKKTLDNNVYIKELKKEIENLKVFFVDLNIMTNSIDANNFNVKVDESSIEGIKSKNIDLTKSSIINILGIGESVFRMYRQNLSIKEISKILSLETGQKISEKEIDTWLKNFNNLSLSQRGKVFCKGSVFDARQSYQDIYETLLAIKNMIENENDSMFLQARTTKAQVLLEYTRESRQLIKIASDLTSKVELFERMKQFQSTILEVIHKRYPAIAEDIIQLLVERKIIEGNLTNF